MTGSKGHEDYELAGGDVSIRGYMPFDDDKCPRCGLLVRYKIFNMRNGHEVCKFICDSCHLSEFRPKRKNVEGRSNRRQNDWAEIVKRRDGHRCKICGTTENLHAHHIIPVKTAIENKQFNLIFDVNNGETLCSFHHKLAHGHTPHEFESIHKNKFYQTQIGGYTMFEIKLTVELVAAPQVIEAINSLSRFFGNCSEQVTPSVRTPEPVAPVAPAVPAAPITPTTSPNQTVAPASQPTPVQTASVPVATPASVPQTVVPTATSQATTPVPMAPQPISNVVPLAQAPQYTIEQIQIAGGALMDAQRGADLIALLQRFGVQAVTELKPEQFGAFVVGLRELGAQI